MTNGNTKILDPKRRLIQRIVNSFNIVNQGNLIPLIENYNLSWFHSMYFKNPINFLFSNDQFLTEFFTKYPHRKKISDYKLQLKEKKKLSLFYGYLSKKQIQKYLIKANSSRGDFAKNFIGLLEQRLDVILYRSQFVNNIPTARQMIIHKKVMVNNQIVFTPSYSVNPGDMISIVSEARPTLYQALINRLNFEKKIKSFSPQNFDIFLKNIPKQITKKQVQFLIFILIKKMDSYCTMKSFVNPFRNPVNPYFTYYSLKKKYQTFSKLDREYYKKFLPNLIRSLNSTKLLKEIFFLSIKNNLYRKYPSVEILKNLNYFGLKPLNLEISYKLLTLVYLYVPQRVYYPLSIDFDLIKRCFSQS